MRRHRLPFLLVGLLAGCSAPSAPTPGPAPAVASSAPRVSEHPVEYVFADLARRANLERAFPAIEGLVEASREREAVPGYAVGVVIDGELAYERGFGFADVEAKRAPDADTVFRIGSISKTFTATAVLALRDEGLLALDEPLTRLVPEASGVVVPTVDSSAITLRQLVTHTSGLFTDSVDHTQPEVAPTEGDVVKELAGLHLAVPPGTRRLYSNFGFGLLGVAGGRAARKPFDEVLRERIFGPLGMTSSGSDFAGIPKERIAVPYKHGPGRSIERTFDWRWGAMTPAGGIHSTVRDMAKYAAMHLAAHPARNAPDDGPLRRSTLREAHAQGLPWYTDTSCELDKLVHHAGGSGGYGAQLAMLPEYGVAVVVLRNLFDSAIPLPEQLAKDILLELAKTGALAKRVPRSKLAPAFAKVVPELLALLNGWDDARYAALLSKHRWIRLDPEKEKVAFARLREAHGGCTSFEPMEVTAPFRAKHRFTCERGKLELDVSLSAFDGGIDRHIGSTSRGLLAPPAWAKTGEALAALIGAWDPARAEVLLAGLSKAGRVEAAERFRQVRESRGSCVVNGYQAWANAEDLSTGLGADEPSFEIVLGCERGSEVYLRFRPAAGRGEGPGPVAISSLELKTPPDRRCLGK